MLRLALVAAVGLAALVVGAPPALAEEPRIEFRPNGSAIARFDDGCVVTYNRDLDRSGSQGCRPQQVQHADRAYRAAVARRGEGGLRMDRHANGSATVRFDNFCQVTYDQRGRRSGSQNCTPQQVQAADRHVQRYWRE